MGASTPGGLPCWRLPKGFIIVDCLVDHQVEQGLTLFFGGEVRDEMRGSCDGIENEVEMN